MDVAADGIYTVQERPPTPQDLLRRLRDRHRQWAFVYDPHAGLYHAVRGGRHFITTDPDGTWHRASGVRL